MCGATIRPLRHPPHGVRVRLAAVAVVVGAALGTGGLVTDAQGPTFSTGVDIVEVPVVVRDRDGSLVTDLSRSDFTIVDQGVEERITVFTRVSLPRATVVALPGDTAQHLADVSTNDELAKARIFVLVLDSWHVAPQRTAIVRQLARQFIERHVGEFDLVAVASAGGVDEATQDFTRDTARLVAAIDRFAGMKLPSASVELEQERREAALHGVLAHGGRDPSDFERADRGESLTRVLEALAGHLNRVQDRRKSLVLFSEGIDYNLGDVGGRVQRYATTVAAGLRRAVGALQRANVSVYVIDPRRLSGHGELVEHPRYQAAPTAPRIDGTPGTLDLSDPGSEGEYSAAVATLRHLAESTGGIAAVTTNDVAGVFERVVGDSSEYYVLGYTPTKRGKAGEYRAIDVRVLRTGMQVFARQGYRVPPATSLPPAHAGPVEPPPPAFGHAARRAHPFESAPPDALRSPTRVRGLSDELQALLASPLPQAGLSMRLHAIPLAKDERTGLCLVLEIAGASLRFAKSGSRFEEQLEIAIATLDARARASNGRTVTLNLRLTADELHRVRATGIRWLSRLDLPPGRHQVRVAAHALGAGVTGLVTHELDVPRFTPGRLGLSGLMITSLPAVLMITRGDSNGLPLQSPPTTARAFVQGDRLTIASELYVPAGPVEPIAVLASLEKSGVETRRLIDSSVVPDARRPRTELVTMDIDTATLPAGTYLMRLTAHRREDASSRIERSLMFEVLAPQTGR